MENQSSNNIWQTARAQWLTPTAFVAVGGLIGGGGYKVYTDHFPPRPVQQEISKLELRVQELEDELKESEQKLDSLRASTDRSFVVLMDSADENAAHDKQAFQLGQTNADRIAPLLASHAEGKTVIKELVNSSWGSARVNEMIELNPDLIFIHQSAFGLPELYSAPNAADNKGVDEQSEAYQTRMFGRRYFLEMKRKQSSFPVVSYSRSFQYAPNRELFCREVALRGYPTKKVYLLEVVHAEQNAYQPAGENDERFRTAYLKASSLKSVSEPYMWRCDDDEFLED